MALAAVGAAVGPVTVAGAKSSNVLYNSTVAPLPHNLPSLGFQATQTAEFGNQIRLTKAGHLTSVVVTMSSWGCQTGSWSAKDCVTTPGSTFTEPITLNIYNANAPGTTLPGSLITTRTQTFKIPYRPSSSPSCTTNGGWGSSCVNGKAVNITFALDRNVPQNIVFGVAYNTSQYGYHPYGALACESTLAGCPYDSLNVAVSQDPTNLSKGSDPVFGKLFWNTSTASNYCDSGLAGSSFFRLDSPNTTPCWGAVTPSSAPFFIPAVKFNGS